MSPSIKNTIHHVLWTGGFDSTFRVCQLLIGQKRIVQPIYATHMGFQDELLFDSYGEPNHIQKPAMPHEMQALALIKASLRQDFPTAASRLLPTYFLPSRKKNHDWSEETKIKGPGINSGRQYSLLRFIALQYEFPVELCIERSSSGHNQVGDSLIPWAISDKNGGYCLPDTILDNIPDTHLDPHSTDNLENLRHFHFPLLHTRRQEMMTMAQDMGFQHILKQTWSCRNFRSNRKPCGECFCCLGRKRDNVFWPDPLNVTNSDASRDRLLFHASPK